MLRRLTQERLLGQTPRPACAFRGGLRSADIPAGHAGSHRPDLSDTVASGRSGAIQWDRDGPWGIVTRRRLAVCWTAACWTAVGWTTVGWTTVWTAGIVAVASLAGAEADPDALPPEVQRPDFLRNRPYIPDELLVDKREHGYITGIPAVGWDAEEGFNVGAFLELYENGSWDDPFFRTTPYRRKILVGGVVTTEEVFRILGRVDWPNIADTANRIRLDALFENSQNRNYFGVDDEDARLRSPRSGQSFRDFQSYQDDLDLLVPGGQDGCAVGQVCTNARYDKYEAKDAIAVLSLERDMLGGLLRPLLGFQVRWIDVDDLTGERVDQVGGRHSARQLPTRLFRDCQQRIVDGCRGGWDNFVKLGLSYDTRDFAPNPTRGVFAEAVAALSARAFGSEGDYQRITLSGSVFRDLFEGRETSQNLIFAARATYHVVFGNPPFYAMPKLGFSDFDRAGLGGYLTFRGLKSNRLVGESAALVNGELRWFFAETVFIGEHLRFGLAGFTDMGRSFEDATLDLRGWKFGGGGGFRLAWNLATLVSFDLAATSEDQVFYMELGTQF